MDENGPEENYESEQEVEEPTKTITHTEAESMLSMCFELRMGMKFEYLNYTNIQIRTYIKLLLGFMELLFMFLIIFNL